MSTPYIKNPGINWNYFLSLPLFLSFYTSHWRLNLTVSYFAIKFKFLNFIQILSLILNIHIVNQVWSPIFFVIMAVSIIKNDLPILM